MDKTTTLDRAGLTDLDIKLNEVTLSDGSTVYDLRFDGVYFAEDYKDATRVLDLFKQALKRIA